MADIPGDTSTTVMLPLDTLTGSTIDTSTDHDWFKITLTAGTTYRFLMIGAGSIGGALADPVLSLRNGSGGTVAINNDSGHGLDAFITYTPNVSGTYFADAADSVGYSGSYFLLATEKQVILAAGTDPVTGTDAAEAIIGDTAGNTITAGLGNDIVYGFDGNDRLVDADSSQNGGNIDKFYGGNGDDTIVAPYAAAGEFFDGGEGNDTLDVSGEPSESYTITLGATFTLSIDGGDATFSSFENAIGTRFGDTVTGSSGANTIQGNGGNDKLNGNGGSDSLDGGAGSDTAVYSGSATDFQVKWNGTGTNWTVADKRAGSPEGADTLKDVEKLTFAIGSATLSTSGSSGVQVVSDSANRTDFVWVFNADASSAYTDFDNTASGPWNRIVQVFDAQSRLDTSQTYNDDGSTAYTDFDQAAQNSWTRIEQNFDTHIRLDTQRIVFDSGTVKFIDYDQANAFSWREVEQNFDAQGRLDTSWQRFDDGTARYTDHDQANTNDWTYVSQAFNAANQLTATYVQYDNGTFVTL